VRAKEATLQGEMRKEPPPSARSCRPRDGASPPRGAASPPRDGATQPRNAATQPPDGTTQPRNAATQPPTATSGRPLLLVDIDGVISLFGFSLMEPPPGAWHWIDGIPHFLSTAAAQHLLELVCVYDLVWASGWEEKAEEYLPHLLGLPRGLPFLRFARTSDSAASAAGTRASQGDVGRTSAGAAAGSVRAHWKLAAIEAHAGPERPLAWLDDAFNDACHAWAAARPGPTLLVPTEPHIGLTEREARQLRAWGNAAAQAR
jgi:hypothetical protein